MLGAFLRGKILKIYTQRDEKLRQADIASESFNEEKVFVIPIITLKCSLHGCRSLKLKKNSIN